MILGALVRAPLRSGAGWMEILVGADRRRRWRAEEKLRIVAETEQPGASFAAVARRHEISRGLLWNWRQQVRRGALAPAAMPVFVPVRITPDPVVSAPMLPPSRFRHCPLRRTAASRSRYRTGRACVLAPMWVW